MTKTVTFHVGAPKTGTSSIQGFLDRNRAVLARHGVHYPPVDLAPTSAKTANHTLLAFALTGELASRYPFDRAEAQRIVLGSTREALAQDDVREVLFSNEMLYNPHEKIDGAFLRDLVGEAKPRIVVYGRRLDEWLESLYRQFVWGRIQPHQTVHHDRPLLRIEETPHARNLDKRTVSSVVDSYQKYLPGLEVIVRPFSAYRSGGLVQGFLEAVGLDAERIIAEAAPEHRLNDSREEALVFFLYHLQRAGMSWDDCRAIGKAARRLAMAGRGAPGFEGRKLRFLPEAQARRAFDLYMQDVARFEGLAADRGIEFRPRGGAETGLRPDDVDRLVDWLRPKVDEALLAQVQDRLRGKLDTPEPAPSAVSRAWSLLGGRRS